MPTRLVDVGVRGSSPSLVESHGMIQPYLALSHRWGGARIIQTTQGNVDEYRKTIPFDELCKTFQDALLTTRKLGYRYIWIDSLCIIQDSPSDWEQEAARMATIYRHATLTLSAACATSGDTGLFQPRTLPSSVRVRSELSDGRIATYLLAKRHVDSFGKDVVDGPLNTRAWCLQERHLSSRIVHYGRTQLFWECQEAIWEEASTETCNAVDRFSGYLTDGFVKHISTFPWKEVPAQDYRAGSADEYSAWYWLASQYTRRAMTMVDDKLPAISGLASVFASYRQDKYLAGLWQGDLAIGLLWCADVGVKLTYPASYRAPSWSWASRNGSITINYSWDGRVEVRDVKATVETSGLDPYGKVKSGFVELHGHVEEVILGRRLGRGESEFAWANANVQLVTDKGDLVGNGCLDDIDGWNEGAYILCLMIFRVEVGFRPFAPERLQQRGEWAWCLLLKQMNTKEHVRIGLAQVHQAVFSVEFSTVTIV